MASAIRNILGRGKKSPEELIVALRDGLNETDDAEARIEKLDKALTQIKIALLGDPSRDKEKDVEEAEAMAQQLMDTKVFHELIESFPRNNLEVNKQVVTIFNNLLQRSAKNSTKNEFPFVDHLIEQEARSELLTKMLSGYEDTAWALLYGQMLQNCITHKRLCNLLLSSPGVFKYFDYIQNSNFEIQSDAFETFKLLLTTHQQETEKFLSDNYHQFFADYEKKLLVDTYVVKRQSLELLGDLIMIRGQFRRQYLDDARNLQLMMELLLDTSNAMKIAAFQVFRVFIANPKKSEAVHATLYNNKRNLLKHLATFCQDNEDTRFIEDREAVVNLIQELEAPSGVQKAKAKKKAKGKTKSKTKTKSKSKGTSSAPRKSKKKAPMPKEESSIGSIGESEDFFVSSSERVEPKKKAAPTQDDKPESTPAPETSGSGSDSVGSSFFSFESSSED